jgi:hypothetical protein
MGFARENLMVNPAAKSAEYAAKENAWKGIAALIPIALMMAIFALPITAK